MLQIIAATDIGRHRSQNQDTFAFKLLSPTMGYGLVCDGMGGAGGGAEAAQIALQQMQRVLDNSLRPDRESTMFQHMVTSAIDTANAIIFGKAQGDDQLTGMGTTIVLAIIKDGKAFLCHAGDSRIYRIAKGQAPQQITKDHTVVQMMVDNGEITPEQALTHEDKRFVTRAVGAEETIDPDFDEITLNDDDMLLLCSDGLYNMLPEEEIQQLAIDAREQGTVAGLITRANDQGGIDNITAMLLFNA